MQKLYTCTAFCGNISHNCPICEKLGILFQCYTASVHIRHDIKLNSLKVKHRGENIYKVVS